MLLSRRFELSGGPLLSFVVIWNIRMLQAQNGYGIEVELASGATQ